MFYLKQMSCDSTCMVKKKEEKKDSQSVQDMWYKKSVNCMEFVNVLMHCDSNFTGHDLLNARAVN